MPVSVGIRPDLYGISQCRWRSAKRSMGLSRHSPRPLWNTMDTLISMYLTHCLSRHSPRPLWNQIKNKYISTNQSLSRHSPRPLWNMNINLTLGNQPMSQQAFAQTFMEYYQITNKKHIIQSLSRHSPRPLWNKI